MRAMFDDRKTELLKRVNLALTDTNDPMYPLFPKGDKDTLTLPADADTDDAELAPAHREGEFDDEGEVDEDTELRVDQLLLEEAEQDGKRAADAEVGAQAAKKQCNQLAPMFQLAQRRGIEGGPGQ